MIQGPGSVFKEEVTITGDLFCILAGHFLTLTVSNSFSPFFNNRIALTFTLCVISRRLSDVFLSRQTSPQSYIYSFCSETEDVLPRLQRQICKRVIFLLTELFQMLGAVRFGKSSDSHQWTWIPSQSLTETILLEVDLPGINASLQNLKVSLERTETKQACIVLIVI